MERITVLIADDHAPFRAGLRALLQATDDVEVVSETVDGIETIIRAARLQPDVIPMDLQMPGIPGVEARRQILHTSPHIAVLIVIMFEDDDFVFAALRAIRGVSNGEAIFGSAGAKRLVNYFAGIQSVTSTYAFPELTEREREILDLVASHLMNQEIAERLQLSLKTVRNHVSNIFSKLQGGDHAQAILRAKEAG